MAQKFNLNRDVGGIPAYAPNPAVNASRVLAPQNTVVTFTVPPQYSQWAVNFSVTPGANVFVSFDGTNPTVPSGTVDTNPYPLLPKTRIVAAGATIKVICPDVNGAYITAEYWVADIQTNVMV